MYEISAAAINKQREARLMTKFDHQINLPSIFKEHDLTIQPNTRGTYLIGHFESYKSLIPPPEEEDEGIEVVPFPTEIETIDPTNLYSESAAILCALNSGIVNSVLEEETTTLTVLGRMSTGKFNYRINDTRRATPYEVRVENAQLEIDSGIEGERSFAVIEAKNTNVEDFLIRQLYYPYRLWAGKTRKDVVPVFMTFSNDIFSFYVYRFTDDSLYNSIELVRRKRYQIGELDIELSDIVKALAATRIGSEPDKVPFPQADSFDRIVDLLTRLKGEGVLSRDEITNYYAFDPRQTSYYTSAAKYLGLVDSRLDKELGAVFYLTREGAAIMGMKQTRQRNLALVNAILARRVFNRAMRETIDQGSPVTTEQAIAIMQAARLDNISKSTIPRRASTVTGWINWIVRLQKR
ncbi:MAG TPA: hypothetical protein VGW12_17865 [Pyrinomonadaceae bacterium]|nr:hypothetical protein [Pyrinomonadaceae bacterium]